MEKEFVTYEQALALKELGFDEPCFGLYNKDRQVSLTQCKSHEEFYGQVCSASLKSQIFRWFRETHGIFIQPNRTIDTQGTWYYFSANTHRTEVFDGSFKYEEAENACIDKLIEILYERINDRNIMDVITTMG